MTLEDTNRTKARGLSYLESSLEAITKMSDKELAEYIDVIINKNDKWVNNDEIQYSNNE